MQWTTKQHNDNKNQGGRFGVEKGSVKDKTSCWGQTTCIMMTRKWDIRGKKQNVKVRYFGAKLTKDKSERGNTDCQHNWNRKHPVWQTFGCVYKGIPRGVIRKLCLECGNTILRWKKGKKRHGSWEVAVFSSLAHSDINNQPHTLPQVTLPPCLPYHDGLYSHLSAKIKPVPKLLLPRIWSEQGEK